MDKAEFIANNFPFPPTVEQLVFCDKIAQYLQQHPEKATSFILKGYAGTGKTTAMAALVKSLPAFKFSVVLLAPTGRAAKVLGSYAGKTAFTIHKKIYRKRSAISPEMSFQLAPNTAKNTLFIVDEASMIDDEWNTQNGSSFLKDLIRFVYQPDSNGRDKNCKLLLVGDTAQLPPVGSTDSPALNQSYLNSEFGLSVEMVELREVVRQAKKSGILRNATLLRNRIIKQPNDSVSVPKLKTKGYPDSFRMNGQRLVEGLEYAYKKVGIENSLVICRSNKSANLYNIQIRSRILYRDEELTGGDQIMVVRNNYFWLPENEHTAFIANGDMAKVRRVRKEEERYGFKFAEVSLDFIDFPEVGIVTCKVLLDTLQVDTPNLPYSRSKQLYESLLIDYEHIKDKKQRLQAIKEDPYYNALQIKFAYAVTCHKAQGGQWDVVFVDQGYLTDEMIDVDFLRWLYTAITRAKREVFFVNFSAEFFNEENPDDFF